MTGAREARAGRCADERRALEALPEKKAREALKALERAGVQAWIIGRLEKWKGIEMV